MHFRHDGFNGFHQDTLHPCMPCTDGGHLCNEPASHSITESGNATLVPVDMSAHSGALPSSQSIRGAPDAVVERVTETMDVNKIGFRPATIDVDGEEEQLT